MFKYLDFQPLRGLASPHLQTLLSTFGPAGNEPDSTPFIVSLSDGNQLCCQVSTPPHWLPHQSTIVMVHGLGGSHLSSYMIRLARKFYRLGIRVVRVNLRGCGSGEGLSDLPYTCGNSHDIHSVLEALKAEHPLSPIDLMGFSLGGNIVLKMAGELGEKASGFVNRIIAVCPVLDLVQAIVRLSQKSNRMYHNYYLKKIQEQSRPWTNNKKFASIYQYDEAVTVPLWGYASVNDYYEKCSSYKFISDVKIPCDLLLAADDPFIEYDVLKRVKLSSSTNVWLTAGGGHMGFIGKSKDQHGFFWLDNLLLKWSVSGLS